ncbi:MAG: efflux RND transporter periplasmic adaptor subunit [Planctomycetaceae bacterium]|jgi:membrane fusion protein (multidrug efflux system)|nr:efflux RND transporter periplasmic adaptor subunit [Planctomycetaceae bacterium]
MKNHRRIVLFLSIAITCLLFGAAAAGYTLHHSYSKQIKDPKFLQSALQKMNAGQREKKKIIQPVLVRVSAAKKEAINTVRPFHGHLTEIQLASVSTEVSGLVVALPIEAGQRVEGGKTLIAQIDKTWLELALAQTAAEINILEQQYAYHKSELERSENAGRAVSESELDNQRMLREQFHQSLEKAKLAYREANEKLRRTTILAPFDGYIVRRVAHYGELLLPGATIAEIVSLGKIDAIVNVGEEFINRVKIGTDMPIIIDKLGIEVIGKVHAIVPYAVAETRSFPVIVRLDDRDGLLKTGMSATALVSITDPKEEIVVPQDAVLEKPDGSTVWTAVEEKREDGTSVFLAKPVPVRVAAQTAGSCGVEPETAEGKKLLVAGTKTVIEGAERLTANQQIRIAELDPKLLQNLPPASGHKRKDSN